MKSKLRRLTAILVTTAAAVIGAPTVAMAATTAAPGGMWNVGVTHEGRYAWDTYGFIQHRADPAVDSYAVRVVSGSTVQNYTFSDKSAFGYVSALKIKLDPCASHIVSVTPGNAVGTGPTSRMVLPPHLPGGVRAASVKRNSGTAATFTWSPPAARGTHFPEWTTENTQLYYLLQLVRMTDNKVVQTGSISSNRSLAPMSYKFTGLEAKKSYVLRVTASSSWGSCAAKTGRILLKPVS